MNKLDIIRAWKDEDYRETLIEAELPEHPAGIVELDDDELTEIRGAAQPQETHIGATFCLLCQK